MANDPDPKLTVLTKENCRAVLSEDGIVFVQCWSPACGACVAEGSVYAAVAGKHPQHTFAKLDTQAERELSSQLEIVHVPTLLLYRDGILLFKQAGNFDEARLEDIIAQVEGLNMDDVRAEMERERSNAKAAQSSQ
jgi:thioredoxin 1